MKAFRIEYDVTEAIWVTNRYVVEVEAETEAEAREMVEDAEVTGDWVEHRCDEPVGGTETGIDIESLEEVVV